MTDVLVDNPRYVLEGGELDTPDFADVGTCTLVDWVSDQLLVSFTETLTAGQVTTVTDRATAPFIPPVPATVAAVQPSSSPTPDVIGGIGALLVRWSPITNPTPVEIEVHVSATTPVPSDGTALLGVTSSTQYTIRTLPDGTALSYIDATGAPLPYYVKLRARSSQDTSLKAGFSAEDSDVLHQITGPDISVNAAWVGTMTADKISGGTLDSDVILGGSIYSEGAAGERVSLSDSGFTVSGPTALGNPIYVNFPTDGAKPNIFSGTVEAATLEVTNGATLRSTANMVASQAQLTVSSGVQPPQAQPAVDITWPTVNIDTVKRSGSLGSFVLDATDCYGLAWDSTNSCWLTAQSTSSGQRIWQISTSGVTSVRVDVSTRLRAVGVARVGTRIITLSQDTDPSFPNDWYFSYREGTGISAMYNRVNTNRDPCVGTDGTNVLVGERVPGTNELRVRVYAPGDMSTITETINTTGIDLTGEATPGGVLRGTFDFGSTRVISTWRGGPAHDFEVFSSTGVQQPDDYWPRGFGNLRGFAHDGANFWALNGDGTLQKYTGLKWTSTDSSKWWAAYTWRDTNAAGTGTHETPMGPQVSTTMKKRAQLVVTTTALPPGGGTDDPNAVGIYLGRNATAPARTAMWQQTGTGTTLTTSTPTFAGTNPPATNNFPSTAPGKIASEVGGFSVDGNSNGSPGTGTFRDGIRSDIASQVATASTMRTNVDARVAAKISGGTATATTNGSGDATFSHSLGVTPSAVIPTLEVVNGAARLMQVTAKTSTTFTVHFWNASNVALAAGFSITVGYVAIA